MLDLLIVVPCYNYGKYINECINSIVNNVTFLKYRIVIIDDCSTDNSWNVIKKIDKSIATSIRLPKNSKTSVARNVGIKQFKSKFVLCIDADDVIPQNYINELYTTLQETNSDIVYTNSKCFGDKDVFYNWPEYDVNRLRYGNFINCSALFKREVWEKNQFDETMLNGYEDYDFWLMASKEGFKFKKCNNTALLWRIKNKSRDKDSHSKVEEIYGYLDKKHNGWFLGNKKKEETKTYTHRANLCMATFNRIDFTKKSIESIIKTASNKTPYMISVVDNGSIDGSQEYLKELFDQKKIHNLLLLPENIGISRAHNTMWKLYNDIDYYAKIDNDIVFNKEGWLDGILDTLDNAPELGCLGYNCEYKNKYQIVNNGKVFYRSKIQNIGGACFFVPRHVHKRIGFWCEDYQFYGEEDCDFGIRINIGGFKNAYMVDEEMVTQLGGSPNEEEYVKWKLSHRDSNIVKFRNPNIELYKKGIKIYQDSNEIEKYRSMILTNI